MHHAKLDELDKLYQFRLKTQSRIVAPIGQSEDTKMTIRGIFGPPDSWYEQPSLHEAECQCEKCHEYHVEACDLSVQATEGFSCCSVEIDYLVRKGEWCLTHGGAFMKRQICTECLIYVV